MAIPLNIIFDLGGVLFDWNPQKLLQRLYPDPVTAQQVLSSIFEHQDWKDLDRGRINQDQALCRMATRTGRSETELHALLQHTRTSLTPLEDSWALVRQLHAQQIPLYVMSNMPARTYQYLRQQHDRWHYFSGILISAEVGLAKPEPAIFDYLLSHYRLDAAQSIFIDDNLENITCARKAGLQAIHFTGIEHCRQQLQQRRSAGEA